MKEGRSLFEEVLPKVKDILTDDQKAKLKEAMSRGPGGRHGGRGQHGNDKAEQPNQST